MPIAYIIMVAFLGVNPYHFVEEIPRGMEKIIYMDIYGILETCDYLFGGCYKKWY